MDSCPGGYIPVHTELEDAPDSCKVHAVGRSVSSWHGVRPGKTWTRVAACIAALSGLLWFVAHGATHVPAGAGHTEDFDNVSQDVEQPKGFGAKHALAGAGHTQDFDNVSQDVEQPRANGCVLVKRA